MSVPHADGLAGAHSPPVAPPSARRVLSTPDRGTAIAFVLFLLLATLVFIRGFVVQDAWIGGHGDEVLESWYLGWVPWAITHGHNPLFTNHVDFPGGVNVMWNTSLPLLGVVGAPIGWLLGPRAEYHVWLAVGVALSAFFAFLFARRRVSWLPAVVAGAMYGFSPFVLDQAGGHLHESFALAPPLLLLLVDDLVVRRTRSPVRSGVYIGLLAAAQVLVSEEVLTTMVVVAPIALTVLALLNFHNLGDSLNRLTVAVLVAAPVALVFVGYPLLVQFFGAQHVHGAVQTPNIYVSDLLNIVVPNKEYLTPPAAASAAANWTGGESSAYLSVPGLLLLGGILALLRRERMAWWCALMTAAAFVLSLGPSLHVGGTEPGINLPWAAFGRLPLLQSVLPARFSLYMFLFAGLMIAWGLERARDAHWRRATSVAFWSLTVVTVVATAQPTPAGIERHPVPTFFATGSLLSRVPDGSVALVAPWTTGHFASDIGTDVVPLLWQNTAGFRYRMASGYALVPTSTGRASFIPPSGRFLRKILRGMWERGATADGTDPTTRSEAFAEMHALHIGSVIVGPMTNRALVVRFFTALFGRPGTDVGGVMFWSGPFTQTASQPSAASAGT